MLGVAVALVIMVYVIAGGLFAATWNDILHTGVKTVGCAAALAWLISANPTIASAAFHKGFSWAPLHARSDGALSNWATLIALGIGDVVALDFMERVFAAKTPQACARCVPDRGRRNDRDWYRDRRHRHDRRRACRGERRWPERHSRIRR